MSVHDDAEPTAVLHEEPESDTDDSECESACETSGQSDEDEDDNEWSGQDGNIESLVFSAVGSDYSLAAFLIPLLHRDFNLALKSKVEKWRRTTAARDGSDGSAEVKPSPTETSSGQDKSSSRKRRRTNSDGDNNEGKDGWDEGEDEGRGDGDGDGGGKMGPPAGPAGDPDMMLACPFHKLDPVKYGVNGGSGSAKRSKYTYRPCAGPGFKSIQRLKEHLKRVHSPVQCERCKQTFSTGNGRDRAQCLEDLAAHRKSEVPCALRDATLKEGVDEAQWAKLEKQNRKKNQEVHRVEKWFEMWDVLFPGVAHPKSPWHENTHHEGTPKEGEDYFTKTFLRILDHKLQHGDISLSEPKVLRERLKSIVQTTFRTYVSMRPNFSSETSSSGVPNHPSRTGGSSTQQSAAETATSHQGTTTTAPTSVGSQQRHPPPPNAYTLDSPYGLGIGMTGQTGTSPQFIPALPPVTAGAGMHASQAIPRNMSFGGINTDNPNQFYYTGYTMFPTQGPWIPGNVPFQASPMPHNSPLQAADWYFPEQNFGTAAREAELE
ncbi:POZ-, AT hook-, and zinc finger-containing protein 1 [Madurella fahalii]|uniref:POZ-, AT hook-, and zinc finger-containing protein 1 n=1 Tax=Madurella fahalii TaxID=1157608 RepID=A0ABQ0G4I9_9PEZI